MDLFVSQIVPVGCGTSGEAPLGLPTREILGTLYMTPNLRDPG